jgi:hypothetical protein
VVVPEVPATPGMPAQDESAEEDHGDDEDRPGQDSHPRRNLVEPVVLVLSNCHRTFVHRRGAGDDRCGLC